MHHNLGDPVMIHFLLHNLVAFREYLIIRSLLLNKIFFAKGNVEHDILPTILIVKGGRGDDFLFCFFALLLTTFFLSLTFFYVPQLLQSDFILSFMFYEFGFQV